MSKTFAATLAIVLMGVPAFGQQTSPATLTLVDALADATNVPANAASSALQRVSADLAHSRGASRTSVNTVVGAQPMAGAPLQYLITAEYTLDAGSAARRLGALQHLQSEVARSGAALTETTRATVATVVDAFFSVAAEQAALAAQEDAVALARRSLQAAALRHAHGVAPQLDIERGRAQLATVEAERDAAKATLAGELFALGELVAVRRPSAVELPMTPERLPDPDVVESAALRTNSAVRAAEADYRAAQAAARLAHSELAPDLTFGIGPGYSRAGRADALGPAGSATFSVPVGNRLDSATVSAAEAAVLVAQAALDQSRRQAVHDALHARSVADGAAARLLKLRDADESARRVADADLAGYRLGAVSSGDLVVAETQSSAARAALESARVEAARTFVALQLAMGELQT